MKIQTYFNANGYTSDRNYQEYIQKFFLDSGPNNMYIYADKINREGVLGFYIKEGHKICINEDLLTLSEEKLDSTLCHEFIHFLVMHDLKEKESDSAIFYGGFINEALTEMLTQQIYPKSAAYGAQVAMHKYANLLSNTVNNYRKFLRGRIDAGYGSYEWRDYLHDTSRFQNDFNKKGYIDLSEAKNNENYVNAQRDLLKLFIKDFMLIDGFTIKNQDFFHRYVDYIVMIMNRPVKDQEYIDKLVDSLDKKLINLIGVNKAEYGEILKKKLVEVRELIKKSKEYDDIPVYEFDFEGYHLAFDKDGKVYGNYAQRNGNGMSIGSVPSRHEITFSTNNNTVTFNLKQIDFDARERNIQIRMKEISNFFTKTANDDFNFLRRAISQEDELIKLERFSLPISNFYKRKPNYIYVATYKNKKVILGDYVEVGTKENIHLSNFVGMVPDENGSLKNAGAWGTPIDNISHGDVFSNLKDKNVRVQSISLYTHDLKKTLSEEVINRIIEEFKCTGKYDEEDSEEEIKYYALYEYAKKNFDKLSQEEKDGYKTLITDKNDKFMMVEYNGETVIGELVRNILYKGKKEVLYEKGKKGLYDEFLPIISSKSFAISEEKQQLFKMKEQLQNYNNRPLNQEIGYDGDKTCKKPIR